MIDGVYSYKCSFSPKLFKTEDKYEKDINDFKYVSIFTFSTTARPFC